MLIGDYEFAYGSVPGKEHRKIWKNNHDACELLSEGNMIVGVIADGCGSGKHSEVGAKIISKILPVNCVKLLKPDIKKLGDNSDKWLERVRQDTLAQIRILANQFGGSLSETITNYFLFTVVGFIILPEEVILFSLGDGHFVIKHGDLETHFIAEANEKNEPPYLAYGLVSSSFDGCPEKLQFKIEHQSPVLPDGIVIGTDGLSDLIESEGKNIPGRNELVGSASQFWDDKYYSNSDAVRRRLYLISNDSNKKSRGFESGLLPDDTTILALRRKRDVI